MKILRGDEHLQYRKNRKISERVGKIEKPTEPKSEMVEALNGLMARLEVLIEKPAPKVMVQVPENNKTKKWKFIVERSKNGFIESITAEAE